MKKLLIAVVAVASINAHARDEAYCSLAPVVTTYAYNAAVANSGALKKATRSSNYSKTASVSRRRRPRLRTS